MFLQGFDWEKTGVSLANYFFDGLCFPGITNFPPELEKVLNFGLLLADLDLENVFLFSLGYKVAYRWYKIATNGFDTIKI